MFQNTIYFFNIIDTKKYHAVLKFILGFNHLWIILSITLFNIKINFLKISVMQIYNFLIWLYLPVKLNAET